jgi:hypothetical protein
MIIMMLSIYESNMENIARVEQKKIYYYKYKFIIVFITYSTALLAISIHQYSSILLSSSVLFLKL